jgi:predicted ATPase
MAQIEHGIALFRSAEVKILQPFHWAMAAEVSMALGQLGNARAYLDVALEQVKSTGERWFAPEAYRLMGVLLAGENAISQAEEMYGKALQEARRQDSKGWELRAAISYAKLLQQQGRSDAAVTLLRPIYSWFTEGFSTRDLSEAQMLLSELDRPGRGASRAS